MPVPALLRAAGVSPQWVCMAVAPSALATLYMNHLWTSGTNALRCAIRTP